MKEVTPDGGVIKTITKDGIGWETVQPADGAVVSFAVTHAAAGPVPPRGADHLELERVSDAPGGLAAALAAMKARGGVCVDVA